MSESDSGPGRREVAYRLFAAEFEDADLEHSESDEERAPNYVVTPTGARVNRLFVVGVLTEVESVSDDVLRGRVVDPTGAFVLYAGQYQQDERAFLDRADPPAFVAVTGKARTFQPDDSDRVFTSVRPESISEVDAGTRDRWTVDAAEQTVDRVQGMATAMALGASGDRLHEALIDRGVEEGLADGVALALDHYGTTPTYLAAVRDLALDAARHVAGDLDEVPGLDASPADAGDVTAADLLDEPVEPLADEEPESEAEPEPADAAEEPADATPGAETSATADQEPTGTATATETETTTDAESVGAESPGAESAEEPATETEAAGSSTAQPETDETPADDTGTGETDTTESQPDGTDEADEEGPGDFEPGEFDLDEEEREEIEEEYGTEFQTGTEVEEPGEADIETPDHDELEAEAESADGEADSETAAGESTPDDAVSTDAAEAEADAPEASEETDDSSEPDEDVDLVDAVVDAMEDLDDGDGADRDAVVDAVSDRTGADQDAVEDAVQEALMDGRCYEPDDSTLMPI